MRARGVLLGILVVAAAAGAGAVEAAPRDAAPAATTLLRLHGIGPLRIGMTRAAAVATGWLAKPHKGCSLGGPPLPVDYRLAGPKAPEGVRGTAEFMHGRLRDLAFSAGVRTSTRVTVGHTTVGQMVHRYRRAGYVASSQFADTFGGRFVTVRHHGSRREVLSAFANGRSTDHAIVTLAVPSVPVCE